MTASTILNDGTYHFFSETILPNGRKFLYEKDMAISCNTPTSISIGNIGMEKINGKLPEKFDFVMSWLGGALYPLTVRIDDMGKAKEIVNIDEVRERYAAEGQRIMEYYEQAPTIVQYVKKCIERAQDEKDVLRYIAQSNLYQLATACMDISNSEYRLVDFPFIGDILTFCLSIEDENEAEMLLTIPEIETERKLLSHEGKVYVHRTGKGTFDHIQLMLTVEIEDEGYYTRRLELKKAEEQ